MKVNRSADRKKSITKSTNTHKVKFSKMKVANGLWCSVFLVFAGLVAITQGSPTFQCYNYTKNTMNGVQVDIPYQCCVDAKELFETNNYELPSAMDSCRATRTEEIMKNSNSHPYWNEDRTVCTHDTTDFPCSAECQDTCRNLGGNVIQSDTRIHSTKEDNNNNVEWIIQNDFDCLPPSCDFSSYYQARQVVIMAEMDSTFIMTNPKINGKSPETYYGLQFECQPGNNKLDGQQIDISYECCRDTKAIVERNNHEYNQALHECGLRFQEVWDGGRPHCQSSTKKKPQGGKQNNGQGGNQNNGQGGNQGQGKQVCRFDNGQLPCLDTCRDICGRWVDADAIEYDETVDCENYTLSQMNRFTCLAHSCEVNYDIMAKVRGSMWEETGDNCEYNMANLKINGVYAESPSSALHLPTSQVLHIVVSFVIYSVVMMTLM